MCPILGGYGDFLIPVHALVWTALGNQLAVDVLNFAGLSFALQALSLPPNRNTEHSNQLNGALFNPSVDRRLKRLWPQDLAQ